MTDFALALDDVHRHFADHVVLEGLSFSVRPGEVFALLGRNGAGKTTALRILLGFLQPHHGTARVLGRDSHMLTPLPRVWPRCARTAPPSPSRAFPTWRSCSWT